MTPFGFRISMWLSPLLKRKLLTQAPIALILWAIAEYSLASRYKPDVETLRLLYSSFFQGFAALAGLLLAILGLNYQRLKDSQAGFFNSAKLIAVSLFGGTRDDYDMAMKTILNWYSIMFRSHIDELSRLADIVVRKHPTPLPGEKTNDDVEQMREMYHRVMREVQQYEDLVSNLGRFKKSDDAFQNSLPAESILAIIPAFVVMLLSAVALSLVDHAESFQAFVAIALISLSMVAILYAVLFFRTMLKILFGGGRIPGYDETGLPKPVDAKETLRRVAQETAWM